MKIIVEMTNEERKLMSLVDMDEKKIENVLLEKIDNISIKKLKFFTK